jgi:hypothetical protein
MRRPKNNKTGESSVKFVPYQAFLEVDYHKNDWKYLFLLAI